MSLHPASFLDFAASPFSEGLPTRRHGEVGLLRTYFGIVPVNDIAIRHAALFGMLSVTHKVMGGRQGLSMDSSI
jgi:hypothetical protein